VSTDCHEQFDSSYLKMNFLDTLKNERIIVSERSDGIVAHPLKPAVCPCVELNRISYKEAWTLQQDIVSARNTGRIQTDVVLILEHEPVFTIGRNGDEKNLKISEAFLNNMNISVIRSERGGILPIMVLANWLSIRSLS